MLSLHEEKKRLLEQVSRTSDHDSSVIRANSFAGQDWSSKCRFPWSCLVATIIFFPYKMAEKIKDYTDITTFIYITGFSWFIKKLVSLLSVYSEMEIDQRMCVLACICA